VAIPDAGESRWQMRPDFSRLPNTRAEYPAAGNPLVRVDIKQQELIGNFAREGHTHTHAPVDVLDHDFPSAGEGKLTPHGHLRCGA
jgi:hypothetical protein